MMGNGDLLTQMPSEENDRGAAETDAFAFGLYDEFHHVLVHQHVHRGGVLLPSVAVTSLAQ